jgi:hypothetical protein
LLIHHVLECFGDVSALRSLRFLLDLHARDEADVVVLFDLLTVHPYCNSNLYLSEFVTPTPFTLSKSNTTKEDVAYYILVAQISLNSIMHSYIHPSILASPFFIVSISAVSYHWKT